MKAMEEIGDILGKGSEKPKKELKEVRVRKAGKGHIYEHHHTHPEHHPMEEHITSGNDDMIAHMMSNMGNPEEAASGASPDAPDAAAQMAG
jgi:hypothetical protein